MSEPLIEYRKIGLLATCIGNERIRLDADGGLYHARNTRECGECELWSDDWRKAGDLDAVDVERLLQEIRESGVLALPAATIDEAAEGGRREELVLRIDGAERRFAVQNCDVPPFRRAVQVLWGALQDSGSSSS